MRLKSLWLLLALSSSTAWAEAHPLTLNEAVGLALRFDPGIAQARTAHDRADLGVLRAQLDRFSLNIGTTLRELFNQSNIGGPTQYVCTVNVSGTEVTFVTTDITSCTSQGGSASARSNSSTQGLFNVSANLVVPLFSGFRVEANVKRAQLTREAAEVTVQQARKDTALSVARAYWQVRRFDLLLAVQQESLARMRDSEAVTEGRVQAGVSPPIDRNRARLRRVQQEAALADMEGSRNQALAQLGVLLGLGGTGRDPTQELMLVDRPTYPERGIPPLQDLLAEAEHVRPEVRRARLQVGVQEQVVRMARSAYYPQVSAFGLIQFGNNPLIIGAGNSQAQSNANPFSNITGLVTVGASLSMNFFDTLNTYTSVKDARYELARLVSELKRVRLTAEIDVRTAYAQLDRLYRRRAGLLEAREVARDNLAILQARYQNGEALVIEFLEAQIDLANTEMQLADLTAQLQSAWLELDAALGHLVGASS